MSHAQRGLRFGVVLAALGLPGLAWATRHSTPETVAQSATVNDDDAVALGQLLYTNDCLMCHGSGIVEQQHLNPTQWKAEIQKMIGLGATLAPEDVAPIQAYLDARFGPRHAPKLVRISKPVIQRVAPEPLPQTVAGQGQRLFAEQCAKCHGVDARGGEPGQNLVETPVLMTLEPFRKVISQGRRKMPGFQEVLKESDADQILAWLRTLNYNPAGL